MPVRGGGAGAMSGMGFLSSPSESPLLGPSGGNSGAPRLSAYVTGGNATKAPALEPLPVDRRGGGARGAQRSAGVARKGVTRTTGASEFATAKAPPPPTAAPLRGGAGASAALRDSPSPAPEDDRAESCRSSGPPPLASGAQPWGSNSGGDHAVSGRVSPHSAKAATLTQVKLVLEMTHLSDMKEGALQQWLEAALEWAPGLVADTHAALLVVSVLSTLPWERYDNESIRAAKPARILRAFEKLCTQLLVLGGEGGGNSATHVLFQLCECVLMPFESAARNPRSNVHIPVPSMMRFFSSAAQQHPQAMSAALQQCVAAMFPKEHVDADGVHATFVTLLLRLALDGALPSHAENDPVATTGPSAGAVVDGEGKKQQQQEQQQQQQTNHMRPLLRRELLRIALQKLLSLEIALASASTAGGGGGGQLPVGPSSQAPLSLPSANDGGGGTFGARGNSPLFSSVAMAASPAQRQREQLRRAVDVAHTLLLADLREAELQGQATQGLFWLKDVLFFHVERALLLRSPAALHYLAPSLISSVTSSSMEMAELTHKCLSLVAKGRVDGRGGAHGAVPLAAAAAAAAPATTAPTGVAATASRRLVDGAGSSGLRAPGLQGPFSHATFQTAQPPQRTTRPPQSAATTAARLFTAEERSVAARHLFPLFTFMQHALPAELIDGTARRIFKWVGLETAANPVLLAAVATPVTPQPPVVGAGEAGVRAFPIAPATATTAAAAQAMVGPQSFTHKTVVETLLAQGLAIASRAHGADAAAHVAQALPLHVADAVFGASLDPAMLAGFLRLAEERGQLRPSLYDDCPWQQPPQERSAVDPESTKRPRSWSGGAQDAASPALPTAAARTEGAQASGRSGAEATPVPRSTSHSSSASSDSGTASSSSASSASSTLVSSASSSTSATSPSLSLRSPRSNRRAYSDSTASDHPTVGTAADDALRDEEASPSNRGNSVRSTFERSLARSSVSQRAASVSSSESASSSSSSSCSSSGQVVSGQSSSPMSSLCIDDAIRPAPRLDAGRTLLHDSSSDDSSDDDDDMTISSAGYNN